MNLGRCTVAPTPWHQLRRGSGGRVIVQPSSGALSTRMDNTQGSPELPPLPSVAAALRATTERLAAELACPQPLAPHWSEFEWRTARAVAAMHGISGLLAAKLRWRGPEGWTEFLNRQREHTAHRHLRTQELLVAVGDRFQYEGIPVQALKGAALDLEGLYQRGQRPMADLDLLTVPRHAERACEILATLGLRESHSTFKHRVFEMRNSRPPRTFGEHADNDMKVELHERICEPLPSRLTDITHWVSPAQAIPGLNPYPSRSALMAHLLLHAAGAMAYRTLRLIQLHDIALLAPRLTESDWHQLLDLRPCDRLPQSPTARLGSVITASFRCDRTSALGTMRRAMKATASPGVRAHSIPGKASSHSRDKDTSERSCRAQLYRRIAGVKSRAMQVTPSGATAA